jgi:hypothetical protein
MSGTGAGLSRRIVLAVGVTSLVWAAVVAATGGVSLQTGFGRISSRDATRPLLVAIAAILLYAVRYRGQVREHVRSIRSVRPPAAVAGALTGAALAIGIAYGSFVASGSDASGYVSQAGMWLRGELTTLAPEWARGAPWQDSTWTSAPLGYRPSETTDVLVPTYAPGLPMMMAAFQAVGGRDAVYYVVPLLGALAVWMTYLLGACLAGPWAGLIGAILLLTSPTFLLLLVQPMSDVPVTALWAAALWAALGTSRPRALGAGVAAALAVVVRPNLVPLAAIVALMILAHSRARFRDLAVFSAPVLCGAAVIAWLNALWYGSPLRSGYGPLAGIYAVDRIWPNLRNYFVWVIQAQTPLMLLGLAAPVVGGGMRERTRLVVLTTVVFPLAVLLLYLPYFVFEVWWYTRFLLPAYPPLLAGAGAVIAVGARRIANTVARAALVSVLVGAVALHGLAYSNVFAMHDSDARYRRLSAYLTDLQPRSVFVSLYYSGAIRYYTGRDVLRWELLAPESLDTAIAYLRQRGHDVYLVGERGELNDFRRRFATSRAVHGLDEGAGGVDVDNVLVLPLGGSFPLPVTPAARRASTHP